MSKALTKLQEDAKQLDPNLEEFDCDHCDCTFLLGWNETHVSCDVIDGQYMEFTAATCPECQLSTRW